MAQLHAQGSERDHMQVETRLPQYFKLPSPSLRSIFARTTEGYPDDIRPPFWKGQSRAQVIAAWDKRFNSISSVDPYPGLIAFENDMRSKIGPMSIQLPLRDRIESIEAYYTRVQRPGVPIPHEAISRLLDDLGPIRGIRQRSPRNTVTTMRLDTFSGSPFAATRRNVVDETLSLLNEDGTVEGYDNAAVLLWRGQEGGPKPTDVKQRVVFGFPFGQNIIEGTYLQPFIEAVQSKNLYAGYVSNDLVDSEVTSMFDTKGKNDLVVCTDFIKFDQSFNERLQAAGSEIYANIFAGAGVDLWLEKVYPQAFSIPLVANAARMFVGKHGMGSGSTDTNADETNVHGSMQHAAAIDAHSQLNPHSQRLGDDACLTYPGITVKQVTQVYTSFGLEMNPSKQYASAQDAVYLRRWHGSDYRVEGKMVGVYSTYRALGRLLAQERYYDPNVWSAEMVTLRAWAILENCKWHPAFEEFVEFVMKGDKYRLGLDIPGFMDRAVAEAPRAINAIPGLMGYVNSIGTEKNKGILDWRIFKYLSSKAKR